MKLRAFTVEIKGVKWRYQVLPDSTYEEHVGDDSDGVTRSSNRTVFFSASKLTPALVRHELMHMIFASLCIHSASLSGEQAEEVAAEIVELHWKDMSKWSKEMHLNMKEHSKTFRYLQVKPLKSSLL